jgi:hypothetical protein
MPIDHVVPLMDRAEFIEACGNERPHEADFTARRVKRNTSRNLAGAEESGESG